MANVRVTRALATACALLLLAGHGLAAAQEPGRIVGRVLDAQTGAGLTGVQIQVVEGQGGALSGMDGRYVLQDVSPGTVALRIESLGYATKVVTGVRVPAGGAVEQNIALSAQALQLEGIEVSAAAERGSVTRALDQQRTSANIVNAITSEQIARSPDGDAAAALQRVSGVTVQDNKFVFVRGLGERYTTTSLNGARIPSPEPERKVVPLDLFPSGLLQTITTSKTFTPDLPGDFSGAQVNIETREFPTQRQLTFSLGTGYNTESTGRTVLAAPTVGPEWLAFAGSDRNLPAPIAAAGSFEPRPSQSEINTGINAFRNAWSARTETGSPNASFGASLGGNDPLFGHPVAYLGSFTYSRTQDVRVDQVRANALPIENGGTAEIDRYEGTTGNVGVLWGGLLQLSSLAGTSSRFVLNATYNRTADNEARAESGFSENLALPLDVTRLRFVERSVFSSQLKGEHQIAANHRIDWAATASAVERNEPDRSEFVYFRGTDPVTGELRQPEWLSASNESAVRTFGELGERAYEGAVNYRLQFGDPARAHSIKLGGLVRATERDAFNRVYSISANLPSAADRQLAPEQIFDGRFTRDSDSYMRVTPLFQGGSYDAEDRVGAGFAMLDFALTDRLRVVTGARVERSAITVNALPTVGGPTVVDTTWDDILPALSLNYALTDVMNLRLSASRTLARPEYRELAPVLYRDVIGGEAVIGNAGLTRTLITNADVRWEWYPNPGEVLSIAAFAKDFEDPIERVYLATSGTRVNTFVNAEGASNYGVELELRKRLGTTFALLEPLTVFTNATLMRSEIRIDPNSPASITNPDRAMVGQAPYVVNAGLTWAPVESATSATVLYNVVGRRIMNAAEAPLPDVYEQPRHVLDLAVRTGITSAISLKLDVRNLLDSPYEVTQGTVTRESYRTGRVLALGLSWRQ